MKGSLNLDHKCPFPLVWKLFGLAKLHSSPKDAVTKGWKKEATSATALKSPIFRLKAKSRSSTRTKSLVAVDK